MSPGVLGDAANIDDLDRFYETVGKEKGKIDILFAFDSLCSCYASFRVL
jgi:hypothetical protein